MALVSHVYNTCIYDRKAVPQNRHPLDGSIKFVSLAAKKKLKIYKNSPFFLF